MIHVFIFLLVALTFTIWSWGRFGLLVFWSFGLALALGISHSVIQSTSQSMMLFSFIALHGNSATLLTVPSLALYTGQKA